MNIEEVREYALSLPEVTEDQPFGEDHIVFRVHNKIFACISLQRAHTVTLKCEPERAIALRDRYSAISPAWHWNKRYWNEHDLTHPDLTHSLMHSLIRHAYEEVLLKLPKREREPLQTLLQELNP